MEYFDGLGIVLSSHPLLAEGRLPILSDQCQNIRVLKFHRVEYFDGFSTVPQATLLSIKFGITILTQSKH